MIAPAELVRRGGFGDSPASAPPVIGADALYDARLLIIDDEPSNTRLLQVLLRRAGFTNVQAVNTAQEGVAACRREPPDLLLLDVHMPDMNGLELLASLRTEIRAFGGLLPAIVITGDPTDATRVRAHRLGAGDYVTKPFDVFELELRVESLLALRLLHEDVADAGPAAASSTGLDGAGGAEGSEPGARALSFIDRLAEVSQYFDSAPIGHNERVGDLSAAIAAELGLPAAEVEQLRRAARLHDVGKIGLCDEILLKPAALNEFEMEMARRHTVVGGLMLAGSRLPLLKLAEQIALSHHEHWDGRGYPFGLAGAAIPLAGRIVAVADVFDALTHERPYKGAWPETEALQELRRVRGRQLDPAVVDSFLRLAEHGRLPAGHRPAAGDGARRPQRIARTGSASLVQARRELRRLGLVGGRTESAA